MTLRNKVAAVLLTLSVTGGSFIKLQEGTVQQAYLDGAGVATICTGSTYNVKLGDFATVDDCAKRFEIDSSVSAKAVQKYVKVPLSQEQFDVLVSWTFNLGTGNLYRSTMLKKLNAGDYCAAGLEMLRWNRVAGKPSKGLSKRRQAESSLFLKGEYCEF